MSKEELKEIALELLEKYEDAETGMIYEFSTSIQSEIKQLQREVEDYRERINNV